MIEQVDSQNTAEPSKAVDAPDTLPDEAVETAQLDSNPSSFMPLLQKVLGGGSTSDAVQVIDKSDDKRVESVIEGLSHQVNLSYLIKALTGDVTLNLQMAKGASAVKLPRLPEGVELEFNESSQTLTLKGQADLVRIALTELTFATESTKVDVLNLQVEIIQPNVTVSKNVALSFQPESNRYVPLPQTKSSGYSYQETVVTEIPELVSDAMLEDQVARDSFDLLAEEKSISAQEIAKELTVGSAETQAEKKKVLSGIEPSREVAQVEAVAPEPEKPAIETRPVEPELEEESIDPIEEEETEEEEDAGPAPIPQNVFISNDLSGVENYTEDMVWELPDFTVRSTQTDDLTVTITISDPAAGTFNEPVFGTASASYNLATGELVIIGEKDDVDAVLADLEFTPGSDYNEDIDVTVDLEDANGNLTTRHVKLLGIAVDDDVTLGAPSGNQITAVGEGFSFTPAPGTFINPDDEDNLIFTATLSDGSPLPGWLSVDSSTGELSGTAGNGDLGTFSIILTADDGNGNTASDSFDIVVDSSLSVANHDVTTTYTEDTTLDLDDIEITTGQSNVDVTITLSDPLGGSFTTGTSGSVTSTYNAALGLYEVSGDVGDINTLLASLEFVPSADYDQDLTATVVIDDGLNVVVNETLTLNANAVNDAPVLDAPQIDTIVAATSALSIDLSGNFSDVDIGDSMAFTATLADGSALPGWLTLHPTTGVLSGTPGIPQIGNYDIIVTVTDSGGLTVTDQFNVEVNSGALIIGTPGDDLINGNNSDNEIYGQDGDDTINGANGNDTIYGEDGDDFIDGGFHRDTIEGGAGNDTILGGHATSGNDREDSIMGGDGNDYIDGQYHHDRLYGDAGNDIIYGGRNNDRLYAGDGNDFLSGGRETDYLYGEEGTNLLIGGDHRDLIYGGNGMDIISYRAVSHSSGGNRDTVYNFTQGEDKIDLSALGFTDINDLTLTTNRVTAAGGFRIDFSGTYTFTADDFIFSAGSADVAITDQFAATGNNWNLSLDPGAFASIDDGNLTYTAFYANGDVLPWWMGFNPDNGGFNGVPESVHSGFYELTVRATNGSGEIAEDSFTLTVADGIIMGTVNADTLSGTGDNDAIYGVGDDDIVNAGGGNDIITTLGGNDTINASDGNDTVYSGDGDDVIDTGLGADIVYAGGGDDTITGGPDNTNNDRSDRVYGEDGNDIIYGGRYHDTLDGGEGDDYLVGQTHNDYLYGQGGNDTLIGGNQDDRLYAGDGVDVLNAGNNNDYLYGGSGLNFLNGEAGRDYYYGGSGTDLYTFTNKSHSIAGGNVDRIYNFQQGTDKIDLSKLGFTSLADLNITSGGNTYIDDPNSTFQIRVMSNITFTADDFIFAPIISDGDILDQDHIVSTPFSVTLGVGHFASIDDGNLVYNVTQSDGSTLPSWLSFDSGTLTLSGTPNTNQMGAYEIVIRAVNADGDVAEDTFDLNVGENFITGTPGQDTLAGTTDADVIYGLDDDDVITGDADADLIYGAGGNDHISGGTENDSILGGDGNDTLDGGLQRDTIRGGDGDDVIYGSKTYSGADQQDVLYGDAGDDYINGGYHHDTLYGGDGNDTIIGGVHNDRLYAGDGTDILDAGDGYDYLYGQSGFNIMDGGAHRDYYYGGTGTDFYIFSQIGHSTTQYQDRIYNFDQGTDKIDLSKLGFTGIGDLDITVGTNTYIDDPNSTFQIRVMSNVSLGASDFIFSAPAADGDLTLETVETGNNLNVALGGGHFASIDDGNLIYTASLSNGNALPAWMNIDSSTGTITGTPASSDSGSYEIVLRATNGSGDIAEDTFEVLAADNIVTGGAGNDTLTGTANGDALLGFAGDDTLTGDDSGDILDGGDGDDIAYGDAGEDTLKGGAGDDFLHGGFGRDTIDGGDGNDRIIGGHATNGAEAQDLILGGAGNDYIDGGRHHDTIRGGDGLDTVYGGVHNDWLYGDAGNDLLHGGNNEDRLYGGDGDDLLIGWQGRDSIWGGDGKDIIVITNRAYSSGGGRDRLYDFTQGEDRIDLSMLGIEGFDDLKITTGATTLIEEVKSGFRIDIQDNLTLTAADFIFSIPESSVAMDNLIVQTGTTVNQALPIGAFAAIDDGNLRYYATQANGNILPNGDTPDALSIDPDTGTITGTPVSEYNTTITVRAVNGSGDMMTLTFGIGVDDTPQLGDNADNVIAGDNGRNSLFGDEGNDTLTGANGDDYLDGGDGDDSIDGGFNRDLIFGGDGNDTLIGGSNTSNNDREDTIFGGNGDDSIHGGRYHDQLYGQNGADTIDGGVHNDTIWGGADNDTLLGNSQNDWLYGGSGSDSLHGGNDIDFLYGGSGNDTLDGGHHRDTLWGNAGNDLFTFTSLGHSGGGNKDRIMDFEQGSDQIDLSALGFVDINDLTITNNGSITTVSNGSGFDFELEGVVNLTAADFVF